jgi:hypothetical protein
VSKTGKRLQKDEEFQLAMASVEENMAQMGQDCLGAMMPVSRHELILKNTTKLALQKERTALANMQAVLEMKQRECDVAVADMNNAVLDKVKAVKAKQETESRLLKEQEKLRELSLKHNELESKVQRLEKQLGVISTNPNAAKYQEIIDSLTKSVENLQSRLAIQCENEERQAVTHERFREQYYNQKERVRVFHIAMNIMYC